MRAKVKEVSVDMWGGFKKVIREVFPNALIVIDRFHVMKLVNSSLNQLRLKLELKGLKNRCLLLKNYVDLTPEERSALKLLLKASPCLSIAYELKEELPDICHYFINRTTSGVMEGLNNRIKLILRQSYGFKNFEMMREKLLACLFI